MTWHTLRPVCLVNTADHDPCNVSHAVQRTPSAEVGGMATTRRQFVEDMEVISTEARAYETCRGGGVHGEDDPASAAQLGHVGMSSAAQEAEMVAEVGLPITGIQDLRNMPAVARADGAPIEGILHDEEYTGAKTNGDGACGLHSLWGQVDGRAGELYA